MEKRERWANTAAWWIFVTPVGLEGVDGEKSIDAANCHESSKDCRGLSQTPDFNPFPAIVPSFPDSKILVRRRQLVRMPVMG